MAQQLINIGSSPNKGDGDAIRTAFDKVNDNFTELYLDVVDLKISVEGTTGDTIVANAVKGDVIGQDSSVIVDSVNARVNATLVGDVTGSVFADNSTLLVDGVNGIIPKAVVEDSANWDTAFSWGDHNTAGYLSTYTETDPIVGAITGIVKADGAGNISAAVAGTDYLVTETITLATLKTEVAASADFADFQARIAAL
jgi:hypothetical protein